MKVEEPITKTKMPRPWLVATSYQAAIPRQQKAFMSHLGYQAVLEMARTKMTSSEHSPAAGQQTPLAPA
jgi:hypothetical protein